jgi:hypothetical protein
MTDRQFKTTDTSKPKIIPLSLGFMGPPGGGKTKSALRVADGMSRVRGGKPALIDTEAGRALKYLKGPQNPNGHDFHHIEFAPPFVPADFLVAIKAALELNPACVIVDSMSDEHEGSGGYLEWHDREVPNSGGNKWAAWAKPSASRRELVSGFQQIKVPLIFTFRAREKTKQVGSKIVPVGFVPIAPADIVHALDLTCLLPHRANGVAVWQSAKEGEDFVIKFPEFLAPFIHRGDVLSEDFGEALARWQLEGLQAALTGEQTAKEKRTPEQMVDDYVAKVNSISNLDALRDFQANEKTVKFVDNVRDKHPALFDRIVTANTRRANELTPPETEEAGYNMADEIEKGSGGDAQS